MMKVRIIRGEQSEEQDDRQENHGRLWYEVPFLQPMQSGKGLRGGSECHDGSHEDQCDFNADASCDGAEFE